MAILCGIWAPQAAVSSDRVLSAAWPARWRVRVLLPWVQVAQDSLPRGDLSPAAGSRDLGVEGWGDCTALGACAEPVGRCPQSSPSLCLAASLPFVILTLVNSPYKRGFYCNDDSIRYPYKADTITHGLMAGVTITCTVVIVRKRHPLPSGSGTSWHVASRSWVPAQPTSRLLAGQQDPWVEPCSAAGQELPLGQ